MYLNENTYYMTSPTYYIICILYFSTFVCLLGPRVIITQAHYIDCARNKMIYTFPSKFTVPYTVSRYFDKYQFVNNCF